MKPIDSLSDDEWSALVKRAIAMPDAPAQLVKEALQLWRVHGAPQHAPSLLQRWVAVLSFDSWASAPVAAGMRSLPSDVRQLLFEAQGCDIDLRIAPAADGFALSGQLFGPTAEGRVGLAPIGEGNDGLPRSAGLDAQSEFRIDAVSSGHYLVTVHLGGDEIALPPIHIVRRRDLGDA